MTSLKTFTLGDRPAVSGTVNMGASIAGAYAVVDGHRLYLIIFTRAFGAPTPAEADQFIRSFQVLR